MNYRRKIDRLQALPVGAVVLYHVKFEGFKAGFLGIAMFIVINRFLITGIIDRLLTLKRFSLFGFFWWGVNRIYPAYLFIMTVSTFFTVIIPSPINLRNYGQYVGTNLIKNNIGKMLVSGSNND